MIEIIKQREKYSFLKAEHDILLSSRIRFARNFKNKEDSFCLKKSFLDNSLEINKLTEQERLFLLENHDISYAFLNKSLQEKTLLLLSNNTSTSLMINEEDDWRLQERLHGLDLTTIYKDLKQYLTPFDNLFLKDNDSYINKCPTNCQSGLRASVLLHLPALSFSKQIDKMSLSLDMMNFTIRGLYGEGSYKQDFYQISNKKIGIEDEVLMIDNLEKLCRNIVQYEYGMEHELFSHRKDEVLDYIMQAVGKLFFRNTLSFKESFYLLSRIKWAYRLGFFASLNKDNLYKLFCLSQSWYLQNQKTKLSSKQEIQKLRASLMHQELKKYIKF